MEGTHATKISHLGQGVISKKGKGGKISYAWTAERGKRHTISVGRIPTRVACRGEGRAGVEDSLGNEWH